MIMNPVTPIHVVELFAPLHAELLTLLRGLHDEDWQRPTAAPLWNVKDIVAHLLETQIRRLTLQRDGMTPPPPDVPIESYQDLVNFLNQLNADWIRIARRISPRLLLEFMEVTGPELNRLFASLDPFAPAPFSVAWAGEEQSPNWFDIAREYTERWHHQQQIRDAVGAPALTARRWLHPVLDTFVRGMSHTYRHTDAADGTSINLHISGEAGDRWTLIRQNQTWQIYHDQSPAPAATISMDQDTAWRLWTKGLTRAAAKTRIAVAGDQPLGAVIYGMLAIMA